MSISISYAIPVHNENVEIVRLLDQLISIIDDNDQIIIQGDQGNITDEVVSVLFPYIKNKQITYIEYPLNRDFATFKNNMFKYCTGDYIFQIDADELLSDSFSKIKELLESDLDIDMFVLPRRNIVYNITQDYITKMRWNVVTMYNEQLINYPDYQFRLFKNNRNIKFQGEVHERLIAFENGVYIDDYDWAIIHSKTFERQLAQNSFYDSLV